MTLFIPRRFVRLVFFTVTAGAAGFISAEASAMTLSVLMILSAFCRYSIRFELVFAGVAAFAAGRSRGNLVELQGSLLGILPPVILLGGLAIICRRLFEGPAPSSETRRHVRNPYQ